MDNQLAARAEASFATLIARCLSILLVGAQLAVAIVHLTAEARVKRIVDFSLSPVDEEVVMRSQG
jgi:hypothetical protein